MAGLGSKSSSHSMRYSPRLPPFHLSPEKNRSTEIEQQHFFGVLDLPCANLPNHVSLRSKSQWSSLANCRSVKRLTHCFPKNMIGRCNDILSLIGILSTLIPVNRKIHFVECSFLTKNEGVAVLRSIISFCQAQYFDVIFV